MGLAKQVSDDELGKRPTPPGRRGDQGEAGRWANMSSEVSIAGPGFINVKLNPEWLASQLNSTADLVAQATATRRRS